MCLLTKKSHPFVAEEDIVVYKTLLKRKNGRKNVYRTPFIYFFYNFNELYSTELKFTLSRSLFDSQAEKEANKEDTLWGIRLSLSISGGGEYLMISEGFHSAISKKRILVNVLDKERGEVLVKCVIPKGSLYYKDLSGTLLVSNQIIIKNEIRDRSKKNLK